MRLPGDTEIHGTAALLGCQVRRLRLRCGQCRGFRNVRLWAEGSHTANLLLAHPTAWRWRNPGIRSATQSPLRIRAGAIAGASAANSCSAMRNPVAFSWKTAACGTRRIDRLLLVVAIGVLAGSLQGYALSLAGPQAGGSSLETPHELSAPWPGCIADARLRRHERTDGLAADPAPGAGALHLQPQGQATASTGLALQGGAATETTITTISASQPPTGCRVNLALEMCRAASANGGALHELIQLGGALMDKGHVL